MTASRICNAHNNQINWQRQSFNTNTSLPLPLLQHLSIGKGMFLIITLFMLPFSGFFQIKPIKTYGRSKILMMLGFLTFLNVEDKTSFNLQLMTQSLDISLVNGVCRHDIGKT